MEAKSSTPSTVMTLNLRYSALFILPSSQTTREATVSAPWMCEMSKHSMRRGISGIEDRLKIRRMRRIFLPGFVRGFTAQALKEFWQILPEELAAIDDLAVANMEEVDREAAAFKVIAEHVGIVILLGCGDALLL